MMNCKMRGPAFATAIVVAVCTFVTADSRAGVKRSEAEAKVVADAGLARYAGGGPVALDGRGSYGPEGCGELTYRWEQVSGPALVIDDSNNATPRVSGFVQTDEVQRCVFELTVSCGEQSSEPASVEVVIVPAFGSMTLNLRNEQFDPNKPTFIYFGGGNCVTGSTGSIITDPDWISRANVIDFPLGYGPDSGASARTYYHYGDMIIVYLSGVASDYRQPIQTCGWSTGGQPALDTGIRMNRTYQDARYAVNLVTTIDGGWCFETRGNINDYIDLYLSSSVEGESCWFENYRGVNKHSYPNVLNMDSYLSHGDILAWYFNALSNPDMNVYNGGVVAGPYWSPLGPGKNLQLASTPGDYTYFFRWDGPRYSGHMEFYNEALYPGRLPEPVELAEPVYVEDERGYLLTCEQSENAVRYEVLLGSDPDRVADYETAWEGAVPPNDVVRPLFFDRGWWTVRASDEYGSTIHADPESVKPPLRILDLYSDGKMDFKDFAVLARHWSEDESSVDLGPAPVGDGRADVRDLAVIGRYWLVDLRLTAHWNLDEEAGTVAHDGIGGYHGTVHGGARWEPGGGRLGGALAMDGIDDYVSTDFILSPSDGPFSVFVWVRAGGSEQVVISQTDSVETYRSWLSADSAGNLMTDLKRPGRGSVPLVSEFTITDGDWHHIGLVCDGSYRRLYADGAEVAADSVALAGMLGADGGLHIGADSALSPTSFWEGLIDDVRIYDQAVRP